MNSRKHFGRLSMLLAISVLAACGTHRKYEQPAVALPGSFRGQEEVAGNAQGRQDSSIAAIPYRVFFSDPELLALIEAGIGNNNDLQIAVRQIEYASQSLKQAKLGNLPTVGLTVGNATITRPSDNSLNGLMFSEFFGQRYIWDFTTSVDVSWEADIWGKIKNRKEAALASYLQSFEAAKAVRTRLVADIAHGYYNLLMLDVQMDITNKSIALFDSTITMTEVQRDMGLTTTLAVQQQQAARDQAKASLPAIRQAVAAQENALSILTGKMPGEIKRSVKLTALNVSDELPTGIPASMLGLRPDIRQSEFVLRQAIALENVASANMYPSLRISAQGGLNAFEASDWFKVPGSLFGMMAGSLAQPIFNGRQLKTAYKQAGIAAEQAELQFKQSVLNAAAEVSNTLVEIEGLKEQEETTTHQVETLAQAVDNSVLLFNSDMATYLEVLTAQSNKLQAELSLADIQRKRLSAAVTLYRSLGGGWE